MARSRAALLLFVVALSACPARSPKVEPSNVSLPPLPTEPAAGEIRVAYPWEPPTLNPFVRGGDAPATRELVRELFPPLFRTVAGGKTEPWLVDTIVSESPRAVSFTLRDDAVWSDGQPITSADVVFTWQTIMDKRWPIASRAGYDAIAGIDASSPTSLTIRFTRDMPAWRDLFSAGLGVLPKHALQGKDFGAALHDSWPVSGGPFVLAGYTRGLQIVLEQSPHPWRTHAKVKRIVVQFVPDPITALQLYEAGKVDVIGPYSSGDFAARLRRERGLSVTTDTGATWEGIVLDVKAGPLADARVREAIFRATDRNAIVNGLVRAEGERLVTPFAEPKVAGSDAGVDLRRAASLLDQAGYAKRGAVRYKGSASLTISIASAGNDELAARLLRGIYYALRAAGFDCNLVDLDYEQLWRDWLPSERMQAALVRFADAPGGDLVARYAGSQAYPAGAGYTRLQSSVVDASLGDPARAATTILGAWPVVPLYRATVAAAERTGVRGVAANAAADGLLANADEWSVTA